MTISRRNLLKGAAAAPLASMALPAFAQDKIKIGFIFLGPVGDYGWTWAHNKGREAVEAALGDKVETIYTENVAEDASAEAAIRDLCNAGCKLVFTTSYGYMDQTIKVAAEFPDVKFEHCTGFKRADNVSTYNSKFHEGRAVLGTIAGKMSKSGTLGYLGSFKVPEVVLGVNAFALAAQKQNPAATVKLVMIDSWFDPPKEAAATETLVNLGCDVVTTHTDSPAALQILEQKGLFGFGQGADMSTFAPTAHLTAIEDIWGPYYVARAQAIVDGTWASADTWDGMKEGTVVISPYNAAIPADVAALADGVQAGYKDGTYDIFTGPIFDQDGVERVKAGEVMALADLAVIDWFVKGVESAS
ncbi:BMP family ABC transporter substrate-binding protein [Rhodobacter sp. KR11]|jgi:basic membrane protein A|uniref:BMP family ABC transporter substrate-binding protein n=1 Tax=Rhodobacter sp. KR11 TaxID=2974588 RepID=UPI00222252CF|nr:BMP family ABC transporter substrate-binding protein [Rhodobacter sp. KR11]MCW1917301.1 BMP family ABC transporter substrate-binding protein [Rhodobacter sp. KR11]